MLEGMLDEAAIERAAVAVYNFDEDLTDKNARAAGVSLIEPRLSWEDLCEVDATTADAYRGRARAALLAVIGPEGPVN